jgi:Bleomycin resistance protein-like N-terminal
MGRPNPERRNGITQDRSPVRESRTPGSARGAGRKASPYRDRCETQSAEAISHRVPQDRVGALAWRDGKPQTGGTVMVAIRSVAHFSIPVSDIEKSTRFYTEVLGCRHRPEAAL